MCLICRQNMHEFKTQYWQQKDSQESNSYTVFIVQTIRHAQVTNMISKKQHISSFLNQGIIRIRFIGISKLIVNRCSHIQCMLILVKNMNCLPWKPKNASWTLDMKNKIYQQKHHEGWQPVINHFSGATFSGVWG